MLYRSLDKRTLRADFISYMLKAGKAKNTAISTANSVFAMWNKCGEDFFWNTVNAENSRLREIVDDFLSRYYPKQVRYPHNYLTSIHRFKEYLVNSGVSVQSENNSILTLPNRVTPSNSELSSSIREMVEKEIKSADRNVLIYSAARAYLDSIKPTSISLDNYFLGDSRDFTSLTDVDIQFIRSAQNYQQMPNVIKFDARKERIASLTYGFDYSIVKDFSAEDLYQMFRREFRVDSEDNNHNCWLKWSKSIIDAAKFISDFSDVDDFVVFVNRFDYNVSSRIALPLLIAQKIYGMGFALACDTLKELGFTNYPKPDVHLMDIFSALGISGKQPIDTFEAIARMAESAKAVDKDATPYKVDKTFWLICSGRFYLERPEVIIGRHKAKFIELAQGLLTQLTL